MLFVEAVLRLLRVAYIAVIRSRDLRKAMFCGALDYWCIIHFV